jgi:imidazolonepropionase-like amidohydrolase
MAIERGYIPGPRMFAATRAISTTGGYPLEGYAPEIEVPKGAQLIDGPIEARKAAREQLDHGADWIKVYMTHRSWVGKNGELVSQPTLTVEELRARKLHAIPMAESACSGHSTADAIRLNMA